MSRSNNDKPFYVDVGTSIVAIRCASNHDVVVRYAIVSPSYNLNLVEELCDRMNREAAICKQPRLNCEVGTVQEQNKRFVEYCKNHRVKITGHADTCNPKCPCRKGGDLNLCTLAWSQMPYEAKEGGTDGR